VQDVGFFDSTKTGEITSRLTQDCQKAADQVTYNVNVFSRTVVQLITTLCFMLYHSKELTLYSCATVPVVVYISKRYGRFMQKLSKGVQEKLADANENLLSQSEILQGAVKELLDLQEIEVSLMPFVKNEFT